MPKQKECFFGPFIRRLRHIRPLWLTEQRGMWYTMKAIMTGLKNLLLKQQKFFDIKICWIIVLYNAPSPSGKAGDFDSPIAGSTPAGATGNRCSSFRKDGGLFIEGTPKKSPSPVARGGTFAVIEDEITCVSPAPARRCTAGSRCRAGRSAGRGCRAR